ncbi:hypothetical protein H9W90_10245 [Polaribacter pectinis]|uniref:Uncharacterized protein n=1 Tax=Polaribacter pectinis TaxID=2738844 RepID=A0A7G9L7H7_9FLAO|nr:hypothetical protein [Polaribacter pectinis]QNM84576.1 hypothetical protein H9W90_10245 [Polaribacter pectinis]
MTHDEIIQPNIKSIYNNLIDSVIKKSQELSLKSTIINRRELVNYLKFEHKVDIKEGIYLKNLLKDSYQKASYSKSIQEALVNNIIENDGKNKVYNPNRVDDNIFCLNVEKPNTELNNFNLITNQNEVIKDIDGIQLINSIINDIDLIKREKTISITGSGKVESYREHAFEIKNGYENLIQTYEYVKDINLNLISDFELTRNRLKLIREDLLKLLIDLFGDSIKTSEPEMFKFSEIVWTDFEDTYPKLELFYNVINDEIELFKDFHSQQMRAISMASKEGFNNFLSSAEKLSKSKGILTNADIKTNAATAATGFLVKSGLAVINSRSQAKKTIAQIELDIEKLKQGMQSDSERIMNDILKLGKLQTEIRDKLTPQLILFTNKVIDIILNKITPYYKKIIKNSEIKNLRDSNSSLIIEKRQIKAELLDKNKQIDYCDYIHSMLTTSIDSQNFEYNYLVSLIPEKPKGLYSIISPSNSKKLYKDTLNDWNTHCKPFEDNYQKLKEDKKNEEKLKIDINTDIVNLELRDKSIENELKLNSDNINAIFKTSSQSKEELKKLLEAVKEVSISSKGVLEVNILTI